MTWLLCASVAAHFGLLVCFWLGRTDEREKVGGKPTDIFVVVEERHSKWPVVVAFCSLSDAEAHMDEMGRWFPSPRACEMFVVPLED